MSGACVMARMCSCADVAADAQVCIVGLQESEVYDIADVESLVATGHAARSTGQNVHRNFTMAIRVLNDSPSIVSQLVGLATMRCSFQ